MNTNTLMLNKTDFRQIDEKEPEWLYQLRKEAWDFYQSVPLPDQVVHLWRYTKPKWFELNDVEKQMKTLLI